MEDNKNKNGVEENNPEAEPPPPPPPQAKSSVGDGGGGWGGWGFSPLSVFTDLQKAAEEISRNAAEVAKTAAKSISDMQNDDEDSESAREDDSEAEKEGENEDDTLRKSALDKLEKASEDSILGQGVKAFDDSVDNLASGAWQALGSAWRGGTAFVQKLEHSAANFAESIQHGGIPAAGSVAPSLIESGKAFTVKGMQVLEAVGKETMDLLITETGIEVNKKSRVTELGSDEDQMYEEMTFDRCFYIYGGPEQLEELEALSNHQALLFNRKKGKLPSEQKSLHDGKLKEVQQILELSTEIDGNGLESNKGKKVESVDELIGDEMKKLHDSSISKAADLATGFTNALTGQSANDMTLRTVRRLETLHSDGVHRLSEICCFAVTQLLMFGKSIISKANKVQEDDADDGGVEIDWPEDSVEKAKIIRIKALSMRRSLEAVSNSFLTGITDVAEAYISAINVVSAESHDAPTHTSIPEKAKALSEHLITDKNSAVGKVQDGLQYLCSVVISTSVPTA